MSDFWWKRLPQKEQGYGRVSEWMSRCVDSVDERLNDLPHCLHWKVRSVLGAGAGRGGGTCNAGFISSGQQGADPIAVVALGDARGPWL